MAKSSVAMSSLLLAGAPHAEQKRPAMCTSVPQDEHGGMNFPATVYRVGLEIVLEARRGRVLSKVTVAKVTED